MSTYSDFIGGGGGVAINEATAFSGAKEIVEIREGKTFLKSGYIETDLSKYKKAVPTSPWDVSTASYLQSFDTSGEDTTPMGIVFKTDGSKMYILGMADTKVYEYDLGTAWDVSTASYLQSFSVGGEDDSPYDLVISTDGLKMYIFGKDGTKVYEYDLGTAWDVSTASYLQSFDTSGEDTIPRGLFFADNGLKMYTTGADNDRVYEYDLGTAWDVSTASYLQSFSVGGDPTKVYFKNDGQHMYVINNDANIIREYILTYAWDISTAVYIQGFSVDSEDTAVYSMCFKSDGLKMYVLGNTNDSVFEYEIVRQIGLPVAKKDADTKLPLYIRVD